MENKIRLADAMGILQGPYLNPVQVKALAFLRQDEIARKALQDTQDRTDALKLAIAANPKTLVIPRSGFPPRTTH